MADPTENMLLYKSLMDEIKIRLNAVNSVLLTLPNAMKDPYAFIQVESCFLQTRMICEIIAIAALALHEPSGVDKKLLKSWHAQQTFEALIKHNSEASPQAIISVDTEKRLKFRFKSDDAMSAEELYRIYGLCGDALHRGALKSILKDGPKNYDVGRLMHWIKRITELLESHIIKLNAEDDVIMAHFYGARDGSVLVQRGFYAI